LIHHIKPRLDLTREWIASELDESLNPAGSEWLTQGNDFTLVTRVEQGGAFLQKANLTATPTSAIVEIGRR